MKLSQHIWEMLFLVNDAFQQLTPPAKRWQEYKIKDSEKCKKPAARYSSERCQTPLEVPANSSVPRMQNE